MLPIHSGIQAQKQSISFPEVRGRDYFVVAVFATATLWRQNLTRQPGCQLMTFLPSPSGSWGMPWSPILTVVFLYHLQKARLTQTHRVPGAKRCHDRARAVCSGKFSESPFVPSSISSPSLGTKPCSASCVFSKVKLGGRGSLKNK